MSYADRKKDNKQREIQIFKEYEGRWKKKDRGERKRNRKVGRKRRKKSLERTDQKWTVREGVKKRQIQREK